MKIIAYARYSSGPSYHRIVMPLYLMGKMGDKIDVIIKSSFIESDYEGGCDIVMYNRIIGKEFLNQILELKKKYGFKIVVDIDDFWELDSHHVLYKEYIQNDFAKNQIAQIQGADLVFTTHSRLAAQISQINKNVHVLPNAIPKHGQYLLERKPHHLTRLFWQGSATHQEDIALLQPCMEQLGGISKKIQIVIGGHEENKGEWVIAMLDLTAKQKHAYRLLPGLHVNEYYRHYENADICLIPLLNSPFNRHKSNLKVLEAANLGLPVICSAVHPYLDLPVLYAKNSSDWVRHIQRLVASRKRQKEAGEELAEFCEKNFDFFKINKERKQILEYETHKINV